MAAYCGPTRLRRSDSTARVDPHAQVQSVVLKGKPSPTSAWAISWAIPRAALGSLGRNPCLRKPPRFACRAEELCCTVAPHSCIIGYSCRPHLHSNDIKPNLRPGGAVRLPSRPSHARRRQRSESDRSQAPPLRRVAPGQPGRPLHEWHSSSLAVNKSQSQYKWNGMEIVALKSSMNNPRRMSHHPSSEKSQ